LATEAIEAAGALGAFRHRDFRLFWTTALLSNSAAYMQFIAVPALLKDITGSNTWLGAAAVAAMIPATAITPFAGLLADRVSRRLILIVTQLGQMAFALGFLGLYLADVLTPWRMMALLLGNGVVSGFQVAAWQSFVPTLVPREDLIDAVRLNSVQFQASRALGPALGALAVGLLGIGAAFFINAVTYIPVILAIVVTRPRQTVTRSTSTNIRADLAEGFRFVWGIAALRRTVITSFMVSVLGQSLTQLAAGIATDVYGRDSRANGWLVAALGVGSLITGTWIIVWGGRRARSTLAIQGLGGYVIGVFLTAVTTNFAVGMIGFFVCGLAHIALATSLNTFMQSAVPDEIRGRVVSVYLLGVMLGMPVGSFILGRLSDVIGMREVLLLNSVAFAAFFVVAFVVFGRYREIDRDTIYETSTGPGALAT
jgi:MFS family permease